MYESRETINCNFEGALPSIQDWWRLLLKADLLIFSNNDGFNLGNRRGFF
uniref:Uncharacterized protein n=1 Tax=Triticum urartu TaxID=4572 RepID=A0A8R7TD58_TRIUA